MAKNTPEVKKLATKIKIKKKNWYKIISPKVFGQREVGEAYLSGPETALGRKLKTNLKDLTGNFKDQNAYVALQVNKVNGSLLNTITVGYELVPSFIKRLVRKNTSRIDDSFNVTTKSGRKVVVKTLAITIHKVQHSVRTQLRKITQEVFLEEIGRTGFETAVVNLANYRIQSILKKRLNKVYPLKDIVIKIMALQEKGLVTEEVVVEEPAPAAEVPEKKEVLSEEQPAEEAA